jgi:hypothetical protein
MVSVLMLCNKTSPSLKKIDLEDRGMRTEIDDKVVVMSQYGNVSYMS